MRKSILDLRFPAGGVVKRYAYQQGPQFTSPDALNVRPFDSLEGRERGGSRPGLGKAYYDQLGSGNPIRLLNAVTTVEQDVLTFWGDNFKGTSLGDAWSAASWIAGGLPPILPSDAADVVYASGNAVGAVRSALAELDTSQPYQIDLFIAPYQDQHWGKYQIFLRMNNATPVATTDGVIVELIQTGTTGAYSGTAKVYVAGVETPYTLTAGSNGQPEAGWFSVLVNGNNIKVYWLGVLLLDQNISAPAGARFGFGIATTVEGGICLVDSFRVQFKTNNKSQTRRSQLIASSNGSLYKESYIGKMDVVSVTPTLASDRLLASAENAQKLYIADNGNPNAVGTDGTIDATGLILDAASVPDWSVLGITTHSHVVVISNGTGAVVNGTYKLAVIAAGSITLDSNAGVGGGNCSFRIERAPKVYDPVAGTLAILSATAGQVPTGCQLCCIYRNRLVLGGAPIAPHVWYMSRQGTLTDWDYAASADDAQRAVAGTNTDTGSIEAPLTALIPFSDDYLIYACDTQLWILRGDPAYQGGIDNLSKSVGIVDKQAWCRGPAGELVLLSRDGLYGLAPGGGAYPQQISRERLPRELLDFDNTMYTIQLEYDPRERGVHVYLTPQQTKGQYHWFFDWQTKSFWPAKLAGVHEPTALRYHTSQSAEDSAMLLGCRDGYIRRYRFSHERDDGTAIASHVFLGPLRIASDHNDGVLNELIAALAKGSGAVAWALHVGDTAEAAFHAAAFSSGFWSREGLNYKARPRARGQAAFLKLSNNANRAWTLERLTAVMEERGRQRL